MTDQKQYDLIILGTGLGGTILGSIMARHGRRVLLIDAGTHPRFAIGEATTPDTSFRLKLLAAKYDIPEVAYLSDFYRLRDHMSPGSGIKRSFSFLYHRPGREHDARESHQFPTATVPWGPDCHLFRQETDSYMLTTAARHGAEVRQRTRVTDIAIDEQGVRLTSESGETFSGAYLVDAAGFRSPLAHKFELREPADRLLTNSRALFTHMVDVTPYDRISSIGPGQGLIHPLSQGTLHHVFHGGWLWVIPFDNHEQTTNHLCSVGLLLDRDIHPDRGDDPEREFFDFVARYPSMGRQFENARAIRDWVSTGRIQYSSQCTAGDRWFVLAHAAGFVDPLYSSGLNLTTSTIDLLAAELLRAFDQGDFSGARFAHVEQAFRNNLQVYDQVVANSYLAFQDFDLWDAWYRVWVALLLVSSCMNLNLYFLYKESGEREVLERTERNPITGALGTGIGSCRAFYQQALAHMDRFRAGEASASETARAIRELLRESDVAPAYMRLHDPEERMVPPYTAPYLTRTYMWYRMRAPRDLREHLASFTFWKSGVAALRRMRDYRKRTGTRNNHFLRDVVRTWNRDWA